MNFISHEGDIHQNIFNNRKFKPSLPFIHPFDCFNDESQPFFKFHLKLQVTPWLWCIDTRLAVSTHLFIAASEFQCVACGTSVLYSCAQSNMLHDTDFFNVANYTCQSTVSSGYRRLLRILSFFQHR